MHILKDGTIKQRMRKWYTLRETLEIYKKGGRVILNLKPEKPNEKTHKDTTD